MPNPTPLNADDLASALTQSGAGWMVLSIAAILPILWAFTLSLHFGRPYVIRFLQTLTLRFGGDVWWLSYVLMRDALMMITLALSMIFLMPNMYITQGLPITAPLATVFLFWALVVKLIRDADDDPAAFRLVSILLLIASVLYIVPQVYGLEAADQTAVWDSAAGLGWIPGVLNSFNGEWANPLAWPILDISLVLFGLTGAGLFTRFFLRLGSEAGPAGEPVSGQGGEQAPAVR
ncbi:MAG: hypothetical protein ACXWNG_01240 [Candidatus Limnocylindrales bacterium]